MENHYELEDQEGEIVHNEFNKMIKGRESVKNDMEKIINLTFEEWTQILLKLNEKPLMRTLVVKELFLFGERTGLNKLNYLTWYKGNHGPHSRELEKALDSLESKKIIKGNEKILSKEKNIFRVDYSLINDEKAKKLLEVLPESFKNILKDIIREFSGKGARESEEYIYAVFPRFSPECMIITSQ